MLVVLPSKRHYLYLPIKHIYDTGKDLKDGLGVQSQILSTSHVWEVQFFFGVEIELTVGQNRSIAPILP
jgi:hypothetical protein